MSETKTEIKCTVTCLDGEEKEYSLTPLKRKEAMMVFHNSLKAVLGAVQGSIKSLDFEDVWGIACKLFKFCTITSKEGITEIKNLNDSDYFTDNPDELYLALAQAVQANFPNFSQRLKAKLGEQGLNLQSILQTVNQ